MALATDFVALAAQIEERYRRYLKTTFYLRDPELRESFDKTLRSGRLSRGPFLEVTSAYRRGSKPEALFPKIVGFNLEPGFLTAVEGNRRLYEHQEKAILR
jgi:hypothetical protein